MKKQIRKIVVAGNTYRWMVSRIDANFVCLKIWQSETKSMPWVAVRYKFDDPWLHYPELICLHHNGIGVASHFQLMPIQPNYVARIISSVNETHLSNGGQTRKTLHFESDVDGNLVRHSHDMVVFPSQDDSSLLVD